MRSRGIAAGAVRARMKLSKNLLARKEQKVNTSYGFFRRRAMCSRFLWFWFWRSEGSSLCGALRRVRFRLPRPARPSAVGRPRAAPVRAPSFLLRRARRACRVSGPLEFLRTARTGRVCAFPAKSRVRSIPRGLCPRAAERAFVSIADRSAVASFFQRRFRGRGRMPGGAHAGVRVSSEPLSAKRRRWQGPPP